MITADLPACARIMAEDPLWQRYGISHDNALQRISAAFAEKADFWVAEAEQVQGFIWFVLKGPFQHSGSILLIGVMPDAQNAGIGSQLMDVAESRLFETADDVQLFVSDFNVGAQKLFRRRGYAQFAGLPSYVISGVTELIYRKVKP